MRYQAFYLWIRPSVEKWTLKGLNLFAVAKEIAEAKCS
jgi:hypothetical protein